MKAYGRRSTNSMTYKIKYLPLAVQDLNDIARYLSGFYPQTARRVLKEMREKITKLGPPAAPTRGLLFVLSVVVVAGGSSQKTARVSTML